MFRSIPALSLGFFVFDRDFFSHVYNNPYIFFKCFTFWLHLHAGLSLAALSQPLIGPAADPEQGAVTPHPGAVLQTHKKKMKSKQEYESKYEHKSFNPVSTL